MTVAERYTVEAGPTSPRPTPLPVLAENIPEAMRLERRWVVWRYVWIPPKNEKPGRWTKVPYVANATEERADSTNPATWSSFDAAHTAYILGGKCDGIGFVLGNGYVGFDADHCEAPEHVQLLDTYTERSPSGEGVHSICRGKKPGDRCRVGAYELYDDGRYFTVTGHHTPGTPATVEERTAEIAALYTRLFPSASATEPSPQMASGVKSDDDLLALARGAKNGAKFSALWKGDITGYDSHSEADLALCALLAFWTNRNAAQMDRLFRRSGLMRPKWDERRGDSTIGADLIAKAIASTAKGYTGGAASSPHLVIHRASDVPDEQLLTEFGGRLVRGAVSLLAGPGEGGKGMSCVDWFARLTTGDAFPGGKPREPMSVLICVTEDSMGRVKSRLRAAGADLDRVFFVEGPEVSRGGLTMPSPMMLDDDSGQLVRLARNREAKALFLETVVEHFGDRAGKSRRSTNNEADVRSALAPFRAVCHSAGLFGLGAIHPRKSTEGNVDDSISGSAAFRNVSRAIHHIYRDPEDESDNPVRLLFTSKSNYLARRPPTLRFRILSWDSELETPCSCDVPNCGHEGRVVWEEEVEDKRTAEQIWAQIAERNKPRRDTAVKEAEEFLNGLMDADGLIDLVPQEILKRASAEAIAPAAVKRAKEKLGLVSVKSKEFQAKVTGWRKEKK